MRCMVCDEFLVGEEVAVEDGMHCLCEECARKESNRIYNNLIRIFEADEKVYRMAFAKYGIDDFACIVDEEINNG